MTVYRKIYEQNYGAIPKDHNGRTYEIHHIDGNHSNNLPENLKAVTIQEHFDIHESQRDWGACLKIAKRMQLSPAKLSELATKNNLKRVEEGTNPFQTRPDGSNIASDKVANGTHHFLGGKIQGETSRRRVENGTHNLSGGEIQRKTAKLGHNVFQTNNPNSTKIKCPYCPMIGGEANMKRYHFENCWFRYKIIQNQTTNQTSS